MTEYLFKNNASSNIGADIGTGDVSITVTTGDGAEFPDPGSGQAFHIYVVEGSNTEWMVCTARSTDTLTVTRAASPHSFTTSATVENRLHEDVINSFLQKGEERTVESDPNGTSAEYDGEQVYCSGDGKWYINTPSSTDWQQMNH
jgi:hypothetical protein